MSNSRLVLGLFILAVPGFGQMDINRRVVLPGGIVLPAIPAPPVIVIPTGGDSRTVTEPVFPAVCSQIAATKYIVKTNAVNIDPYNPTCGSTGGTNGTLGCTGGTDYQPSLSATLYQQAESLDNSAVNAALSSPSCVGKAVELVQGTNGQKGFVLSRWSLPSGVGIIIDAGVHVFASRNLSDYAGNNCGLIADIPPFCSHWITAPNTTGSGLYGYGILDGRGWDAYLGTPTQSFYANRIQAYCNLHGGATDGSPACTPNGAGGNSYGPNAFKLDGADDFTMYKVTVKDCGNFCVNWKGSNGGTFWGVKIIAPFEVPNTDGWDPLNSTNGTFTYGYISNGDNHVAMKSDATQTNNITVSHTQTSAGIGIAIGAGTRYGIANILVTDNVQNGNLYNSHSTGLQIGSDSAEGGLVQKITFRNDCMMNESRSVRIYPNYGGNSGTHPPMYRDLLLQNITALASTAPYTTGNSGTFTFQGLSGNVATMQIDNFSIQGVNQGITAQGSLNKDQYAAVLLGPGAVPASILNQFAAGIAVTTSGAAGASTAYPCSASDWHPLTGELNLKTASRNNNQGYTGAAPYTLQIMLEPVRDINTKEATALTASVQFKDNGSTIATVALSGDNTFAQYAVTSAASGAHVYTAYYPGDAHYSAFAFGSITVHVP